MKDIGIVFLVETEESRQAQELTELFAVQCSLGRHDGGVVESPGMVLLGTPFLRRRKSSFIHGAADDANDLSDHLVSHLERHVSTRTP